MSKTYTIAWLPGDGIAIEVMEAARIVLDALDLNATHPHGDIGWEFWCREGDALPQRTIELLKSADAAMFGAITSKPVKAAEAELVPALRGKGLVYRSPIVRMRQLFDLYVLPRAFVFRVNLDDPHPAAWIRVKLSCAMGAALYPDLTMETPGKYLAVLLSAGGARACPTRASNDSRKHDPGLRLLADQPPSAFA